MNSPSKRDTSRIARSFVENPEVVHESPIENIEHFSIFVIAFGVLVGGLSKNWLASHRS